MSTSTVARQSKDYETVERHVETGQHYVYQNYLVTVSGFSRINHQTKVEQLGIGFSKWSGRQIFEVMSIDCRATLNNLINNKYRSIRQLRDSPDAMAG